MVEGIPTMETLPLYCAESHVPPETAMAASMAAPVLVSTRGRVVLRVGVQLIEHLPSYIQLQHELVHRLQRWIDSSQENEAAQVFRPRSPSAEKWPHAKAFATTCWSSFPRPSRMDRGMFSWSASLMAFSRTVTGRRRM